MEDVYIGSESRGQHRAPLMGQPSAITSQLGMLLRSQDILPRGNPSLTIAADPVSRSMSPPERLQKRFVQRIFRKRQH
jgi:hypothetical protein